MFFVLTSDPIRDGLKSLSLHFGQNFFGLSVCIQTAKIIQSRISLIERLSHFRAMSVPVLFTTFSDQFVNVLNGLLTDELIFLFVHCSVAKFTYVSL